MKIKVTLLFLGILFFGIEFALAEIQFKKTKLILGKTEIMAELADSPKKLERGLMGRTTLKDSEGMLFVFDQPEMQSFWMRDTLIPLSIGFFSESGKLIQTLDMEPASPVDLHPKIYKSLKPAKFALEVPLGWFSRKKIPVGTQLKVPELHVPDR